MGIIKFRFKRSLVFETITFTGQNICVGDIRSIICSRYNITEENRKVLLVDDKNNVMRDDSQRVASGLKLIICQEIPKNRDEIQDHQKKIGTGQKLVFDHGQNIKKTKELVGQPSLNRKIAIPSLSSSLDSVFRAEQVKYETNYSIGDRSCVVSCQRKHSAYNDKPQKKITEIMTEKNQV